MALIRLNNMRSVPVTRSNLGNYSGSLIREFDQLFNHFQAGNDMQEQWVEGYPVDLFETDDNIMLQMAVPGISKEDLDISIEKRQLTINGHLPNIADTDERRYWLQSIPRGHFNRSLTLPTDVEVDSIEATIKEGLLTLTMPKLAEAKAKKIAISVT